jgi:hypothetical protein
MVAIAAVTAAVRHTQQSKGPSVSLEDVMPDEDSILKEAILGRLAACPDSSEEAWVNRRIVLTDTELCCGKVNYPKRLDHIPLHEIVGVEALHPDPRDSAATATFNGIKGSATNVLRTVSTLRTRRDSLRSNESRGTEDAEEESKIHDKAFAFEVSVIPDGHNSGRSTVFNTKDKTELAEWMEGESVHFLFL